MNNLFNSIQVRKPKKNIFDLSHDLKLSLDMGLLIPICNMEAMPGDRFTIGCESMLRFAPMIAPVMHRINVTMHYFFVPNRILWPNWEKYVTNGGATVPVGGTLPAFPTTELSDTTYAEGGILDYMGLPDPDGSIITYEINAMPLAAYQAIWNDYYRDQNVTAEVDYKLVDGHNAFAPIFGTLRRRAWQHDYFTSALPWAQKGTPVSLPLGTPDDVPVLLNDNFSAGTLLDGTPDDITVGADTPIGSSVQTNEMFAQTSLLQEQASTINDLRRAFRLQEWLEKNARAGSRYTENILGHFGVHSSDKRLQRPEYITGIINPVIISEVLNTTGTDDAPQGNMAGHGIAVTNGRYGRYFAEEHGYIIGVMSVMPKTAYQQGLTKMWTKTNDPTELPWPTFANIGEQEILNKEIMAFPTTPGGEEDLFGYIPRYAEYKFENNRVAGQFKTSLSFWHWGRIFDPSIPPTLDTLFIECNPRKDPFAVADPAIQSLWAHVYNKIKVVRPLPKFGTPQF